jgi:hypothetical protein
VRDQQADRATHGAGHPAVGNGEPEQGRGYHGQDDQQQKAPPGQWADGEPTAAELPRLQERRTHGAATGTARCRDTSPSSTRVGSVAVRRGPPTGIGTCVG